MVFGVFASPLHEQRHHHPHIPFGNMDGSLDVWLLDTNNRTGIWKVRGIINLDKCFVLQVEFVLYRRHGEDQRDVEFALQSFLDDLQVEQAKEPAAETKAEGR